MTITYLAQPQNRVTLGATQLTNSIVNAKITRLENGWDSATIILSDTTYYPTTVTEGTTVILEVKDASTSTYTVLFVGTVRFVTAEISNNGRALTLNCRSIGAGLAEMQVANEYGTQSTNGLDTITEIITDSTYGIIPNYVQKIFGGSNSNYAYDTSNVATIADSIPYINFPYKPADKCLNDLCDLITAYKAGTAGPHWIVTYAAGTVYLRLKLIDGTQTGWTKYYGNSQANATLTYGVDYTRINLEKMSAESNYVVYYGAWRRPSNGDFWTEGTFATWGTTQGALQDSGAPGSTAHIVGAKSQLASSVTNPSGPIQVFYPSSAAAAWNFSGFTDFNTPNLNFYIYYDLTVDTHLIVKLCTNATNYYVACEKQADGSLREYVIPPDQQWHHFSIPVGPYFNVQQNQAIQWKAYTTGALNWNNINYVEFYVANAEYQTNSPPTANFFAIDGLHFGDADICRVASLNSYVGVIVKQRLITDDIGKDDSLIATDDSGLLAKMAYSELLRLQTTSLVGTVETNMIKDILPGQWLFIQSTDYRVTKITHNISSSGYTSTFEVTSDLINGRSRPRYEDLNKQFAAFRPEWQDRQAANMKAGKVDWRVARLVKTY